MVYPPFGEDLLGDEYDHEYNHVAQMAHQGVTICEHCLQDFCVAEDFRDTYLADWRVSGEEEEAVIGDRIHPLLDNRAIRRYLYRAFLIHSEWAPLERNICVELPKCALSVIRKQYPGKINAYIAHRWRAATIDRKNAVDQEGNVLENLYWVYFEHRWVLEQMTEMMETV